MRKTSSMSQEEFSEKDCELIVALTRQLTGSTPVSRAKVASSLVNIKRRMLATSCEDLADYIGVVESSSEELAHFISAVTIHTTSWFRESPHFDRLQHLAASRQAPLRVLSAGCSSGEEAYTMALVLEEARLRQAKFDYVIEGWDVDPVSVAKANRAIYSMTAMGEIPIQFKRHVLIGSGKTEGFFTLSKAIRDRCSFSRKSLLALEPRPAHEPELFDAIFCRNVLIYFSPDKIEAIMKNLLSCLSPGGHLCLGHSEGMSVEKFGLVPLGNTTYKKAVSAVAAPVRFPQSLKVPALSRGDDPKATDREQELKRPDIILIGASTGGTEVLVKMLSDFPKPSPPVVVIQHIALSFAQSFAERLAVASGLTLATPVAGAFLQENHLYMALGDYHLGVRRRGVTYILEIGKVPPMHGVRPSVDYLFQTLAKCPQRGTVAAILLTGMGKDGALGLSELRQGQAMTFVQDEASSTVFGMPREAIALGAAGYIGNPAAIKQQLLLALQNPVKDQKKMQKAG